MIGYEHFKTCIRAYAPGFDFSRMDMMNPSYVSLDSLLRDWTLDEETALLDYLRPLGRNYNIDWASLRIDMTDALLVDEYVIVLILKEISVSKYARRIPELWTD